MEVIYADTFRELNILTVGYFHDHCYHKYYGETSKVPPELKKYIKEDKKYCFIYIQDKPIIN